MRIIIADPLLSFIRRHGERTFPEECCGALFGNEAEGIRTITHLHEIENRRETNRARRFLITPLQYKEAEETADGLGLQLLGFYHSHPDHPALPSAYDRDHAVPWLTYVIVSVRHGRGEEVTAWRLNDSGDAFESITL